MVPRAHHILGTLFNCKRKCFVFLAFLLGSLAIYLHVTQNGIPLKSKLCKYIELNLVCSDESSSSLKFGQAARNLDIYVGLYKKNDTRVNNSLYRNPDWKASFQDKLITIIPSLKDKYQNYLRPISTLYPETTNVSLENKRLLEHIVRSGYGLTPYKTDRGEDAWMENGIVYRPSRRKNPTGFTAEYESYIPFNEDLFFEGKKPDMRYKTEKKVILWYPKPLYIRPMGIPEPLIACPEFPCLETTNTKYQANSSAVVVTAVFIKKGRKAPRRAFPDQVMVIHNHESQYFMKTIMGQDPAWRSIFNWTFSFRMDADIVRPYAIVRRRPKPPVEKDYKEILALKTGLVFWAVSNCHTNSRREDYIAKLRKYIRVDQMGICGGQKPCSKAKRENCTQGFAPKYKFYLAFENNVCQDYITEKLFNYLHTDMVIVAHGSDDYYRHLPPEIFVNVNDFASPKLLADRLWYLHRNEDAYLDILRAKDQYIILLEDHIVRMGKGHTMHNDFVFLAAPRCLLCQRLWNLERHRKTIPDIIQWYEKGKCKSKIVHTYV